MNIKNIDAERVFKFLDYLSPYLLGGIVWNETGSLGYGLVVQFALTTLVCIKHGDDE